jgi:hypothetical protein
MALLFALLALSPSGTLYLSGVRPGEVTRVNAATAQVQTRRLREVSPGDPPFMLAATGGRVVAFGARGPYSFDAALHEPGRRLGRAGYFIPSATPGRVWLFGRRMREVTVDGETTVPPGARLPDGVPVVGATSDGLLVQRRRLEVWNPLTGATVRKLRGVFPAAVRGSLVASCPERCRELYLDRMPVRPHGFRFKESYSGAFSPDGRLVAVPAGPTIAIVDVATRTATLLPGPRLDDYAKIAWSSSGWLFYGVGRAGIAAWRPGIARATLLPLRVPPSTRMVAP